MFDHLEMMWVKAVVCPPGNDVVYARIKGDVSCPPGNDVGWK